MDLAALATALAAAQGEMKNAVLNKVNPHFKNKYADLPAVRDAVVPILSKHGLSVLQFTTLKDGAFALTTRLLHKSGAFIEGEFPLPMSPDKPQAIGSCLTYARRYALAAICGIASDEDDDAELGEKEMPKVETVKNPPGITKFRNDAREFYRELYACTDYDMYKAFVSTAPVQAFLKEAQTKYKSDWEGDGGDVAGIKADMQWFCDSLKSTQLAAE